MTDARYATTVQVQTPQDGTIECGVISAPCDYCDQSGACVYFERMGLTVDSTCFDMNLRPKGYMVVTFPFPKI